MKSSGDLVQQRIGCCVAQHRVIPATSLSVLSGCRAWISHLKRSSKIAMQCSKKWGLLAWCSRERDLHYIITCSPGGCRGAPLPGYKGSPLVYPTFPKRWGGEALMIGGNG